MALERRAQLGEEFKVWHGIGLLAFVFVMLFLAPLCYALAHLFLSDAGVVAQSRGLDDMSGGWVGAALVLAFIGPPFLQRLRFGYSLVRVLEWPVGGHGEIYVEVKARLGDRPQRALRSIVTVDARHYVETQSGRADVGEEIFRRIGTVDPSTFRRKPGRRHRFEVRVPDLSDAIRDAVGRYQAAHTGGADFFTCRLKLRSSSMPGGYVLSVFGDEDGFVGSRGLGIRRYL